MQTGNVLDGNLEKELAAVDIENREADYALTRAEAAQLIALKRDRLYKSMKTASIAFAAAAVVLMAGFKIYEDFFDTSSRIGLLMESVNAQENTLSAPKVNVRTVFKDEAHSRIVIPLIEPIASENISIREEFIQNKYVITLSGYSENIPNGVELVSDSTIMDAVGVYRQNSDVVVEVYCMDLFDYELVLDSSALTVNFREMGDAYAASAVVWFPYDDRNRLALPEWRQGIDKFAADNHVKLYMASDMQEAYSQEDVIAFANRIHADMVLGVAVEQTDGQQSYITGICNTTYFIPDYNSVHLSVVMAEAFVEATQIGIRGFEEEGDSQDAYPLVSEAIVPAAAVRISLTQKDMESVENEYKLNGKIVEALENTMETILQNYIRTEEKSNAG